MTGCSSADSADCADGGLLKEAKKRQGPEKETVCSGADSADSAEVGLLKGILKRKGPFRGSSSEKSDCLQ